MEDGKTLSVPTIFPVYLSRIVSSMNFGRLNSFLRSNPPSRQPSEA